MSRATVWQYSRERGAGTILQFIGSGPVAVLAGFNLFTTFGIAQRPTTGPWHESALLLHALAVVTLMVTLLMILNAQMYGATPDQRLNLRPEATVDLQALNEERQLQLVDYALLVAYYRRVSFGLTTGFVATLTGLGCAVRSESQGWGSTGAVVLLLSAVLVTLFWSFNGMKFLFVSDGQVNAGELSDVHPDYLRSILKDLPPTDTSAAGERLAGPTKQGPEGKGTVG